MTHEQYLQLKDYLHHNHPEALQILAGWSDTGITYYQPVGVFDESYNELIAIIQKCAKDNNIDIGSME